MFEKVSSYKYLININNKNNIQKIHDQVASMNRCLQFTKIIQVKVTIERIKANFIHFIQKLHETSM